MLLSVLAQRRLGVPEEQAPLRFGSADPKSDYTGRYLLLGGEPAFGLSQWCGTCPFLFERQGGANGTLSAEVDAMSELQRPLDTVNDRIFEAFSPLLPEGEYLPLLLEVEPELIAPYGERDYFTHEQVATWGVDAWSGLPMYPGSFYYRTFETSVEPDEHLYEFVVPMVPPSWNDPARVQHYRDLLQRGVTPTAVALSTLDVCQPAMDLESTDYYAHWGLSHFLLDGHHKLEAAARAGEKVQLLALVSLDGSLASSENVASLPGLLSRTPEGRARE